MLSITLVFKTYNKSIKITVSLIDLINVALFLYID